MIWAGVSYERNFLMALGVEGNGYKVSKLAGRTEGLLATSHKRL
jgi:hypothetical protein